MEKRSLEILDKKYKVLAELKKTFLGYPCDAKFDYAPLYKFLRFPINNVGDPFEPSTYRLQTKEFEREVLHFFADLLHLKDFWGYVTNGGTEGNMYGLYAAREMLPKAKVYFSGHTHYSIKKNTHILRMEACTVASQANGEMDYDDFERKLKGEKTAIILANIGTTMMGAIDDVERISAILEKKGIKYYIHADAALYGMLLPFVSDIKFDFRAKVNSIAISGHKFVGSPIPCGVVLVRRVYMRTLQSYIEYIDAHDTTISGSRDAFTPLLLWYRIKTLGLRGFKKHVQYSMGLAAYLVKELKKIGWPCVHRSFVTVSFKRPSQKLVNKWELASNQDIAHVICMPHETREELRRFVKDMAEEA
jgi:histidine decarboxylase